MELTNGGANQMRVQGLRASPVRQQNCRLC